LSCLLPVIFSRQHCIWSGFWVPWVLGSVEPSERDVCGSRPRVSRVWEPTNAARWSCVARIVSRRRSRSSRVKNWGRLTCLLCSSPLYFISLYAIRYMVYAIRVCLGSASALNVYTYSHFTISHVCPAITRNHFGGIFYLNY